MTLEEQFIDAWRIHNRINLYLLDAVEPAALESVASSKGRSVGEQFAHIHNVRLMWLKAAAPDLLEGLEKIEKEGVGDKEGLVAALEASSAAIEQLLGRGFETGKVKNFKPHTPAFFGYMISHESHHRGQIMLALKQSGIKIDKKIQYGMWEWGGR